MVLLRSTSLQNKPNGVSYKAAHANLCTSGLNPIS